jgi:NAD(P)H-dependent nitrite reductase small subunit
MPAFLPTLEAAALPPGKGQTVLLAGRRIAIFNLGGQFYALDDDCPHRGGPLGPGWVDAEQCTVACPLHGWEFDLKTGACRTAPARPVRSHPVRVVDGKVEVSVQ